MQSVGQGFCLNANGAALPQWQRNCYEKEEDRNRSAQNQNQILCTFYKVKRYTFQSVDNDTPIWYKKLEKTDDYEKVSACQ